MLETKILEEGEDSILAFIVESVGGASTGALVPPTGYMARIREICYQYGVLLIHDEVIGDDYQFSVLAAGRHLIPFTIVVKASIFQNTLWRMARAWKTLKCPSVSMLCMLEQ